jgi:hypothetical protein
MFVYSGSIDAVIGAYVAPVSKEASVIGCESTTHVLANV